MNDWITGIGRELKEQWHAEYIEAVIRRRWQERSSAGGDAAQIGIRAMLAAHDLLSSLKPDHPGAIAIDHTCAQLRGAIDITRSAIDAAHAAATEARYYCKVCGYIGDTAEHRWACNYLALERTPPNVSSDEREPGGE